MACEFLDVGGTPSEFGELAPDNPSGISEYFEEIVSAAVFSICPEYIPEANS